MPIQTTVKESEILIVYFSHTGNTEQLAGYIKEKTGGTSIRLESEIVYPTDHQSAVHFVMEQNKTNVLPELKNKIESLNRYKVVFLGFPVWDKRLPPPVRSFLKQFDLKGKTILPFHTHSGFGSANSIPEIREWCPEATIGPAFLENGDAVTTIKPKVIEWLEEVLGK
ncbi:flavodoxin [Flavobacterium sp. CAU 1735]|uniref:flavodoxin n=1 Tax=Flavobacterium sp. CAU 1735 TaxID=3140361 RepID=UPI003260ECCD